MSDLLHRIRNMIGRAMVSRIDDATTLQSLQINLSADETQDGAERFQDYGFTSVPLPGAEAAVMCAGGLRSHALVIAVADRRYRLKGLQAGEVAIYDDQGQKIVLMRDRIAITSPFKVEVTAPTVIVDADTATITADTVNLGGTGGVGVARIGDHVVGGVITEGSTKVKAL
jgi:phage baseplate assembly protein V